MATTDARREYQRVYKARNRERLRLDERERVRLKRATDPAVRAAEAEKARRWRERDPERSREVQRSYYARNAAAMRQRAADYRAAHREQTLNYLIVPACGSCNSSKHDLTMSEYLERRCES